MVCRTCHFALCIFCVLHFLLVYHVPGSTLPLPLYVFFPLNCQVLPNSAIAAATAAYQEYEKANTENTHSYNHITDDPQLALFKLLMKDRPEGADIAGHDPSNGPLSKWNAKKLDISENGPLARNTKNHSKPWRVDKDHIAKLKKKKNKVSNVGRCVLTLLPEPRDLVYAPELSSYSLPSMSLYSSNSNANAYGIGNGNGC